MLLSWYTMRAKLIKGRNSLLYSSWRKELIGETTYWKVNPTEAQRLVGITMGNLPANEMTQFISAPTNKYVEGCT